MRVRMRGGAVGLAGVVAAGVGPGAAAQAPASASVAELPIREVTVFKDGHALVMRSGSAATDASGAVVLDELPAPVLGTFWAFEDEGGAELRSVRAGRREVEEVRAPVSAAEMVRANIGRKVLWNGREGEILAVLDPPKPEPSRTQPQWNGYQWVQVSDAFMTAPPAGQPGVLLKMATGETIVMSLAAITEISFIGGEPLNMEMRYPAERDRLALELAWKGTPEAQAEVGVMYVERGIRWIPSYKVTIVDDDTVKVDLQAILINEMADLEDVRAHLVVGVPSFLFGHTPDPIGMQDMFAKLGPFFETDAQTGQFLSNSLMSQSARASEAWGGMGGNEGGVALPELGGTDREEDLFLYEVQHLTLAKGERMIVPIASAELPYERVYTLELPVAPPVDAWRNFNTQQQREIALMLDRPMAKQVLRITNTGEAPITTAPAMVVRDGRVLAQHMLTYTAIGERVDLEVTKAVDIVVTTEDSSEQRADTPESINGNSYIRVTMDGGVRITNRKDERVKLEVTKYVLGQFDMAETGEVTRLDMFTSEALSSGTTSIWWQWYSWPWWWHRVNGVSKAEWTIEAGPGETRELKWTWHYLWS